MKLSKAALVSSIAASTTAQNTTSYTTNATVCASGAHIIVARASLETPGYGVLSIVKDAILARIPNSNAVAVPYPATIWGDVVYVDSEPEGVGNMTLLIKEYAAACPGHKMVLMGYSQGAQVIGDTLLGENYTAFPSFAKSPDIDQSYIDNIAAVVMMGDPSNVAGQPILRGNSTHNGTFPRNNTAKWEITGLINKTVSYCDANDFYCDEGNSVEVHLTYVNRYLSQAVDFVVQKFAVANSSSASSSPSAITISDSATASASASSSSTSKSKGMSLATRLPLYATAGMAQCIFVAAFVLAL